MKSLKYIIGLFILVITLTGCQDEDFAVGDLTTPSNIQIEIDVVGQDANNPNGDGSGVVNFTIAADNALSYHFVLNGDSRLAKNGEIKYNFSVTGLETYTLTAIAYGKGGNSSSKTISLDVLVLYEAPADLLEMLLGDGSRTWRIKAEASGHFGLGPVGGSIAGEWFSAGAFEKSSTGMYDDQYVFDSDGKFKHITNSTNDEGGDDPTGTVFGRINLMDELGPHSEAPNGADIENYPLDDYIESWSLSAPNGVETLSLTGLAFMGYYTGGNHQYEIFSRSENEMVLRTTDGNTEFDWWFILTSEEPGGSDPEPFVSIYNNLLWSDEFDSNGAPDPLNWTYDIGTGDNGWGNGEAQSYTNDPSNVIVEGGSLKITAKNTGDDAEVYYYDEFQLVDAGGNTQSVIQDFEGTAPTFTNFGGAISQVISNPDATGENTTANVGELSKGVGSEIWAGSFFELGSALDLSTNNRISIRTWSPKIGAIVKLKIENQDASITHEIDLITTVANTWEELVYDFSGAPTADYVRVVIFFDFGNSVSSYTSARIKTENLFEFTYGRVEVRAKLPVSQGTWPAIWMLGANFDTVGWPVSGEIDIMEQTGQDKGSVSGTLHYPAVSPGSGNTASTSLPTATSEFHNYTVEWTPEVIKFVVDDTVYHEVANSGDLPFHADFFLILNVAMGGTLGGDIDAGFTEDTMEIDYVRVYQ